MSPFKRNIAIGAGVIIFAACVLQWRSLAAQGYFTGVHQEVAAQCRSIASPPGPEDIQIDRERGIAYVSATDHRAGPTARGGLYQIDLNKPVGEWTVYPVTPNEPAAFRPHGLSLFVGTDGTRKLFVINHASKGDEVDIFDIAADNSLTFVRSISDPLFVSANDIVAVTPETFYLTNDHGSKAGFMRWLEEFLLLRDANVVYYSGASARIVATDMSMANGINISADRSSVYVADSLRAALHIFTRDPVTGDLKPRDYTALGTGVDNIDVLPDGALLIGAHPSIAATYKHAKDPSEPAPSQVVRVEPASGGEGGRAGTIYLNKGEELSASSVAAGYKDMMLIGGVFDPKILACKQSTEIRAY